MKKIYFLIGLITIGYQYSSAQTTIWQNDFENPAEWTLNVSSGQN